MSVNTDYSGSRADRKPPAASLDRPGWSIGADPVTYPCPWSRGTTDWSEEEEGNGDGDECARAMMGIKEQRGEGGGGRRQRLRRLGIFVSSS